MDLNALIDVHEQQGTPATLTPAMISEVRAFVADLQAIDDAQYLPARNAELKRTRGGTTVEVLRTEWRKLEDAAVAQAAADADAHETAERARVTSGTTDHAIDPALFTTAKTGAEVQLLLADAEAAGPDALRRAWGHAEPRLREMARDEQRRHQLPGASSGFTVLTAWQAKLRDATRRSPDRTQISEAAARRQREIRQSVLGLADVVGLRRELELAARRSAMPVAPQKSAHIVSGGFFDKFQTRS